MHQLFFYKDSNIVIKKHTNFLFLIIFNKMIYFYFFATLHILESNNKHCFKYSNAKKITHICKSYSICSHYIKKTFNVKLLKNI